MDRPAVLVVGGTGLDTVVPVPAIAFTGADSVPTTPIVEYVAHTGTGVALALRALRVPVAVVDAIGQDEAGQRIRASFAAWGVPLHVATAPAGTRRAVNLMDPDGNRLSLYDGRDTPGYRMPADTYRTLLPNFRHAHVSIMDWARALLPELREAGLSISTDLHDWDGRNPYHRDFALGADLVFLSTVALGDRLPALARDILRDGRASLVVATAGAAGAYLATGNSLVHQPAAALPGPLVNSNGAGDAFVAGFVSGWLAGLAAPICLRRGTVAGAYACTRDVGPDGFITEL